MAAEDAAEAESLRTVMRSLQDSLVLDAAHRWGAQRIETPPGWHDVQVRAEDRVGRPWQGLPAAVLVVQDDGRGFPCDGRTCLGQFVGTRLTISLGDSTVRLQSSIIVLAASQRSAQAVWQHELTHALLAQYDMRAESERHDPRYFDEAERHVVSFSGLPDR